MPLCTLQLPPAVLPCSPLMLPQNPILHLHSRGVTQQRTGQSAQTHKTQTKQSKTQNDHSMPCLPFGVPPMLSPMSCHRARFMPIMRTHSRTVTKQSSQRRQAKQTDCSFRHDRRISLKAAQVGCCHLLGRRWPPRCASLCWLSCPGVLLFSCNCLQHKFVTRSHLRRMRFRSAHSHIRSLFSPLLSAFICYMFLRTQLRSWCYHRNPGLH